MLPYFDVFMKNKRTLSFSFEKYMNEFVMKSEP